MAGTATVGVLRVLMSADSAQITSDLGKARKAVADTRARAQEVDALLDQLDQLDLPVGWLPAGSGDPVAAKQQRIFPPLPASSSGFGGWAKQWLAILWFHFFGWAMTAAAASLGAPFWFDLLKKVISIRSNGQPPAETEKKAA